MARQTSALITSNDNRTGAENVIKKRKHRDKSDLGEDFTAPDGGWAWMVCIAAGLSNLSIYPCLQQFGFLFRVRMLNHVMMTSSEVTSIINTNSAISACTGLLNGPMFRRFSFRQVALAGSLLIFTGLLITAFCESFISYIAAYSLLYGFGVGISVSASSLAINTYFKNRRRHASGFSWTVTGLGPIFLPHVVTFLLSIYGVGGTVMIFAAFALHSFVCGLIYQPVHYHAPRNVMHMPLDGQETTVVEHEQQCLKCNSACEGQMRRDGILSSQYMYQDDDEDMRGFEIMEPGTPMLSRANDGWFGSKLSLSSARTRFRTVSSCKDIEAMNKLTSSVNEHQEGENFFKPNNFKRERDEAIRRRSNSKINLESSPLPTKPQTQIYCTCSKQNQPSATEKEDLVPERMSFLQKVIAFFDLDLLRDITYVNLVAGLTIINFGELNFSILTPFILNDFGFDTKQITLAISLLASMDLIMRFLVPFITEKISWDNRVFFLIGVVGIALGRTFVAITRSYTTILICFIWIGICKGIRTIFWPLIIPSYVPLKRLPAASGLQLLISGLFTLAAGPFVGLIRDRFSYSIALHCLDCMTFLAALSWTLEALVRRYKQRNKTKLKSDANFTVNA